MLICLAPLLFTAAAYAGDYGFSQRVAWHAARNESPVAQALYIFRMSDQQQASRMLVVTPGGRRMIVSHTISSEGTARHTLLDEASGWQVAMERYYGERHGTLKNLYESLHVENVPRDMTIRMCVEMTGINRVCFAKVPYGAAPGNLEIEFFERLQAGSAATRLRNAIPPELKDDLAFLGTALTDEASGLQFRESIELLQRLCPDLPFYPALVAIRAPATRGEMLTDAGQIAFATQFRSVQPTDPLADQWRR